MVLMVSMRLLVCELNGGLARVFAVKGRFSKFGQIGSVYPMPLYGFSLHFLRFKTMEKVINRVVVFVGTLDGLGLASRTDAGGKRSLLIKLQTTRWHDCSSNGCRLARHDCGRIQFRRAF